jgi:RND family efflux transporter MFP subunit
MTMTLSRYLINPVLWHKLCLPVLGLLAGAPSLAASPVQVPVVAVQRQAVGQGFEMDAVVQPVKQATVAAQITGRLVSLAVKAGDQVKAGQLLATLNDSETQAGLQSSQAQVAQSQAQLHNAQANFERTRDLLRQGFVSAAAMDNAEAQLKSAQAARDLASAGTRQAHVSQGYTRVTAPFDGRVLQTEVDVGDLAQTGRALLTIYAQQPLRAVVQVPVSRSAALTPASQIEVQVGSADGAATWLRPANVSRLPGADPVSQTITWRLELPTQAASGWVPGQQIRVRFSSGQAQRLIVPDAAVLRRGELTAVYVADKAGFVLSAVRLGAHYGAGWEVLAGVSAQDWVALDPIKAGLNGAQALPAGATGVQP